MKEVVTIRCTHGNTVHLATVKVVVGDFVLEVEAISHTLPVSVFLWTYVPELSDWLNKHCMAVLTRVQKKKQQQEEIEAQVKDQESGVQTKPQDSDKVSDIINPFSVYWLDNKLFEPSKVKKRLTKKQKRE